MEKKIEATSLGGTGFFGGPGKPPKFEAWPLKAAEQPTCAVMGSLGIQVCNRVLKGFKRKWKLLFGVL